MKEIRIIILEKEDLKQFGFSPEDVIDVEIEDDGLAFHLKESKKEVKPKEIKKEKKITPTKVKINKKTVGVKRGIKKGTKRGPYKKKDSHQAKDGFKVCGKCLKKKKVSEFSKQESTNDKLQSHCRKCKISYDKEWRKNKNKITSTCYEQEQEKANGKD